MIPLNPSLSRLQLYEAGITLVSSFCHENDLPIPRAYNNPKTSWRFPDACAYYRPNIINICVDRCAAPGLAGRQWSYPGYIVDRTPYGVLQHELGHAVDYRKSTRKGAYFGDFSTALKEVTGEDPVTSYCPNDAEWFAEIFRLFVTNPDLLRRIRPRVYKELTQHAHLKPVFSDPWDVRLAQYGAPERYIAAATNKITHATARRLPPVSLEAQQLGLGLTN